MSKYVLAHDLGTSGNKATLYDQNGVLVNSITYSYDVIYKSNGFAEQDPYSWWKAVCSTTKAFLKTVSVNDIAGVSFSAQMNGCLCVDKHGVPLKNHIIWADLRATAQENFIVDNIGAQNYYLVTGIRPTATASLNKLMWVRDCEPEIYNKTYKMLNAKDYIVYLLTGNYYTDFSDASLTGAFDINKFVWSQEILKTCGISEDKFPDIIPSTAVAGYVTSAASSQCGLRIGTPVIMGGGDGACAGVGALSVSAGKTYAYLGSSCWLATASNSPVMDLQMRTANIAHVVPGLIAPLGSMQSGGGAYSWLKNAFCNDEIIKSQKLNISVYELLNDLAALSPAGSNGVMFLPYLLGERSPIWNNNASAAFLGLKMQNNKEDIVRSVLEGVAFNLSLILSVFREHMSINEITLIGGGAKGSIWRKIMADIFNLKVKKPVYLEEATSLGAAVCCGVGIKMFEDFNCVNRFVEIEDTITPDPANAEIYSKLTELFGKAYTALKPIYPLMQK